MIKDNVDISLISERLTQFYIDGYTTYTRDRNEDGSGLLLYIRDNAPSTLLKNDPNFEAF